MVCGSGFVPLRATAAEETPERNLPAGYIIVPSSISPDGHYGVSAYDNTVNPIPPGWEYAPNRIIDRQADDKIVGAIRAKDALMHMGHGEILPCRWSADSSLLLWEVSGKWCPWALTLLRLHKGKIAWQANLLLDAQWAILERTRRADPEGYRAAMKENKAGKDNRLASGHSVFPDGFTVAVSTDAAAGRPLTLPIKVTASLTANPKGLDPYPERANINALMEATVEEGGRLCVTSFRMAKKPFPPFARSEAPNPALQRTSLALGR